MSWLASWCAMLALLLGQGCGDAAAPYATGFDPAAPPTEAPLGTVTSSGTASWTVSVWTAPAPPRKGVIQVLLRVNDAGGAPVDGLQVHVIPWMPAHGHGGSRVAPVTPQGDGWYLVAPVYLYMSGVWELRTSFEGFSEDGVVPVLDVP
ncbi:MAG: FixH family protein [Myxococcales bacterium]